MMGRSIARIQAAVAPLMVGLWFATPYTCAQGPPVREEPLSAYRVYLLLAQHVPGEHIATQVEQAGIDFQADWLFLGVLREAGADEPLLKALRAARRVKPAGTGPKSDKREAPKAEQELHAVLEKDPQDPVLHCLLACLLVSRGKAKEATAEYREALRLKADLPSAHLVAGYVLQKPALAIAEYREALRLKPNFPEAHVGLGLEFFRKHDLDGAVAEYREALRLDPNDGHTHNLLGRALADKGDLDAAIAEHREALRLDPNNSDAHNNLGLALYKKGDREGAAKEFQEALRLDPNNETVQDNLRVALGQGGEGGDSGPLDEATLGFRQRQAILSAHPPLEENAASRVGRRVFVMLLATHTVKSGRNVPYEFTLINDTDVNAFSTAGGKVYVTSGITPLLGEGAGAWAAVESHEVGHILLQHHYKAYLRREELHEMASLVGSLFGRRAESRQLATWGASFAAQLADLKFSRDEESEADRMGLMVMAEAGVHPDFAITLYRRISAKVGEGSRVGTFLFGNHPRWTTREERDMRAYEEALAVFSSRWPDAAQSPGGVPPVVATLGEVSASQDTVNKAVVISLPIDIRNAKDVHVVVAARFTQKGQPVPSALAECRLKDGSLGVERSLKIESEHQSIPFSVTIPAAALTTKYRTVDGVVEVLKEGEVAEQSKPFHVSVPKP